MQNLSVYGYTLPCGMSLNPIGSTELRAKIACLISHKQVAIETATIVCHICRFYGKEYYFYQLVNF